MRSTRYALLLLLTLALGSVANAREYSAVTGRYIQFDPTGLDDGPNGYVYVHANPLTGFDPLGLANGGAAQMWMKKPPSTCTCPDIMAYQAGIGKDGAGGTDYGHHWLELGQSESYGYWPNGSVNLTQTLLGVHGSVNRGRARDPHHGDHASAQMSFPAKSTIPPSSSNSCQNICEQAKQCIRDVAAGYNRNYGGTWSYRGEVGDNSCHTFQRVALHQCRLQR